MTLMNFEQAQTYTFPKENERVSSDSMFDTTLMVFVFTQQMKKSMLKWAETRSCLEHNFWKIDSRDLIPVYEISAAYIFKCTVAVEVKKRLILKAHRIILWNFKNLS